MKNRKNNKDRSEEETDHLLRSPKSAERLLKAIEDDKAGNGSSQKLID